MAERVWRQTSRHDDQKRYHGGHSGLTVDTEIFLDKEDRVLREPTVSSVVGLLDRQYRRETMRNIMIRAAVALSLAGALGFGVKAAGPTSLPDAAQAGDREAVRALLKQAADVNAAQGDGMTALHWAALKNDAELAQTLLFAGANVRATTRI